MNLYIRAFILTTLVFFAGMGLGMLIEEARLSEVQQSLLKLQIMFNDAYTLSHYIATTNESSCEDLLEENLRYNDVVYAFGEKLDEYEKANRFTPELEDQRRLYNLLQLRFLLNSIELKERCNLSYAVVVHVYRKHNVSLGEEIDTRTMAGILWDLKQKCGRKMLLVPLQADSNLSSVGAFLASYNLTRFPATIIDGRAVEGLVSLSDLMRLTNC